MRMLFVSFQFRLQMGFDTLSWYNKTNRIYAFKGGEIRLQVVWMKRCFELCGNFHENC